MLSLLIHGITWGQAETESNPEEERSPRHLQQFELFPLDDQQSNKSSRQSLQKGRKLNQTYFLERRNFF
jgi:hypothetical protein